MVNTIFWDILSEVNLDTLLIQAMQCQQNDSYRAIRTSLLPFLRCRFDCGQKLRHLAALHILSVQTHFDSFLKLLL